MPLCGVTHDTLGEGHDERLQFANILAQVYAQTGLQDGPCRGGRAVLPRDVRPPQGTTNGDDDPATRLAAGQLGVLLNAKSQKLEEEAASDPAALARVYTEAADFLLPNFGARTKTWFDADGARRSSSRRGRRGSPEYCLEPTVTF